MKIYIVMSSHGIEKIFDSRGSAERYIAQLKTFAAYKKDEKVRMELFTVCQD